jgi:hypothetical protein
MEIFGPNKTSVLSYTRSLGVPSNTTYVCSVISPVQPRGVYTYVSEPLAQGTRDP